MATNGKGRIADLVAANPACLVTGCQTLAMTFHLTKLIVSRVAQVTEYRGPYAKILEQRLVDGINLIWKPHGFGPKNAWK